MLPFITAFSILVLLILAGLYLAHLRFRSIEKRLASMDRDLRQFYRDLGRPKADIIKINERKRPS